MTPAGFWRRFAAHLIDTFFVGLLGIAVGMAAGLLLFLGGSDLSPEALKEWEPAGNLSGLVIAWLYYALQESSWKRATLGKRLIGIEVSDLAGERISFLRATGRFLATALSYLTLGVGFLMAAFTARKQALHDIVAGTLVVRTPGASTTAGWVLFGLLLAAWLALFAVLGAMATTQLVPAWQEQQRVDALPPVTRAGEQAARAVEAYYRRYDDFPVSLEDTDFRAPSGPGAPLVSIDPGEVRLVVAAPDGSLFLVMTPLMVPSGIEWMCEADPDVAENYPVTCRH